MIIGDVMKRIVKIGKASSGGVSLEVEFQGLGWIYGYEISTHFATVGSGQDFIRVTSEYFSTPEKAKEWLTELTENILAIKTVQTIKLKEFETLCGIRII